MITPNCRVRLTVPLGSLRKDAEGIAREFAPEYGKWPVQFDGNGLHLIPDKCLEVIGEVVTPVSAPPAPAKAAAVVRMAGGAANPTEAERQAEIVATVTLKYPPTNNNFKNTVIINGHPRMVPTKQSRDYKAEAKQTAIDARIPKAIGPVSVTVKVFRPRRIGDLENTFKCVFDAMTGVAYEDDGQIEEIHAYRFDDKANPRVELTIKEMRGQECTQTNTF